MRFLIKTLIVTSVSVAESAAMIGCMVQILTMMMCLRNSHRQEKDPRACGGASEITRHLKIADPDCSSPCSMHTYSTIFQSLPVGRDQVYHPWSAYPHSQVINVSDGESE